MFVMLAATILAAVAQMPMAAGMFEAVEITRHVLRMMAMAGALDQLGGGRSSGNNDLAKDAGLNDISGSRGRGFNQNQSAKKEDDEGDDDNDDDDNEDEDLDHEDMQDGYNDE